jgi:hypothetical protein
MCRNALFFAIQEHLIGYCMYREVIELFRLVSDRDWQQCRIAVFADRQT